MKSIWKSFAMFLRQITKDSMLIVVCFAPILCGLAFRFGIPVAEQLLCDTFSKAAILEPYYLLFDLLLCILTPFMFCFASSMTILGEVDDGISKNLAVTPLGISGYLISRIVFPAIFSMLVSSLVLLFFSLTKLSLLLIVSLSIVSALVCVLTSILIVTIATNKVEGMAVAKFTGLLMLGLPAPFFMEGAIQYVLSILPSFWVAKLAIESNFLYFAIAMITSILWIAVFYRKFKRKIL